MYLVDTSVWIDFLRNRHTKAVGRLRAILDDQIVFGISGVIYQELLQGAASKMDFLRLKAYFGSQRFFHPKDLKSTFLNAAHLYFDCRQAAITIRSTIDCLIAQIAMEHGLILLHSDRDYERIQKVRPELRLE